MKKIWHIGLLDIRLMVRDKTFFFWVLIFPLVFIFIFGSMYKDRDQDVKASLKIVNNDSGQWGSYFIETLDAPGINLEVLEVAPEKYNRILFIPEDFSINIETKKNQQLTLVKRSGASMEAAAQVEVKIVQSIAKLITQLIVHREKDITHLLREKPEFKNLLKIDSRFPEGAMTQTPTGFDHVIPGVLVQFVMMMVFIYGGITVMMDRKAGTLTRILYSSVSTGQLFGGKFLGRLMMGIVQAAILIATGLLFFDLNLGNVFYSVLNVLIFAITAAAIGIFVGSVFSEEGIIVGISILLANMFSALGGCWWPIEFVPPAIRTAGMISPAYWAMDVFHKIIFFNKGFSDIFINFLVLLGFAAAFTVLAVKFFKIKE